MNIYSDLKQHFYSFPANIAWKKWGYTGDIGIYYPMICFNYVPYDKLHYNIYRHSIIRLEYIVLIKNKPCKINRQSKKFTIESEKRFLRIFNNWDTIVKNIQLLTSNNINISVVRLQEQTTDESVNVDLWYRERCESRVIDLSVPITSL